MASCTPGNEELPASSTEQDDELTATGSTTAVPECSVTGCSELKEEFVEVTADKVKPKKQNRRTRNRRSKTEQLAVVVDGDVEDDGSAAAAAAKRVEKPALDNIVVTVFNKKVKGGETCPKVERIIQNLSPEKSKGDLEKTSNYCGDRPANIASPSSVDVRKIHQKKEKSKSTTSFEMSTAGKQTYGDQISVSKDDLDDKSDKKTRRGNRGGKKAKDGKRDESWSKDANQPGFSLFPLKGARSAKEQQSPGGNVGCYTALVMKNQRAQRFDQPSCSKDKYRTRNESSSSDSTVKGNNAPSPRSKQQNPNPVSQSPRATGKQKTANSHPQSPKVVVPTMVYEKDKGFTYYENAFIHRDTGSVTMNSESPAPNPPKGWYRLPDSECSSATQNVQKPKSSSKSNKRKSKQQKSSTSSQGGETPTSGGSSQGGETPTSGGSSQGGQTPKSGGSSQGGQAPKSRGNSQGGKTPKSGGSSQGGQTPQSRGNSQGGKTPQPGGSNQRKSTAESKNVMPSPQTPRSDIDNGPGKSSGKRKNNRSKQNKSSKSYEAHLPVEIVSEGLKRGTIVKGTIRINPKNYEDAYIPHPDGKSDIYIRGTRDRNRSLEGDVVAVLLNPRYEWKVLMDDLINFEEKETVVEDIEQKEDDVVVEADEIIVEMATDDGVTEADPLGDVTRSLKALEIHPTQPLGSEPKPVQNGEGDSVKLVTDESNKIDESPMKKTPRKNRDSRFSYTPLKHLKSASPVVQKLFADQTKSDKYLQRTGKVVYILEKVHSRATSGYLKLMADKNKSVALFSPIDYRMPRMKIPMSQCPEGFAERPDDFANTLFIARVLNWEENTNFANGQLMKSLGQAGEIEPETEAILMSYDVDFSEFSDEATDCLPKNLPWKIPNNEFESRKDLRKNCVFTIDPATARDLDDALSCECVSDGVYEIGVHIADVSFFVNELTELDRVASNRATSVYLIQKVIPMLPRLLCEQLCSLNPDEDRLTFSVIWKMTDEGEILDEWFGRSVIRSCVKLSYDHAQGFLEYPDKVWSTEELPPISDGFSIDDIKSRVLIFDRIAKNLRKQRFDNGALRMDQVKLQFNLDRESGLPNGYFVYQQKDSNRLIEEFMLLANMAVAHKIHDCFPELAFLRRHPEPQEKLLTDLAEQCAKYGFMLDGSSAGALQRSLYSYDNDDEDSKAKMQILSVMCSKPMQLAKYFSSGCVDDEAKFRHYALNVPLYTHFTSPIRRYADIIVHRQLAAAIGLVDDPVATKEELQKRADNCNIKKNNSKRVQELSSDLFFAVFVKECGPLEETGMVMQVLDKAFDVLALKLGVVKRVYCDQLQLKEFSFAKKLKQPTLTLTWPNGQIQTVTLFDKVECILQSAKEPLRWNATIKPPPNMNSSIS
ncbi:DIS3-like exonuclease 2 isoform X2 [Tubulanus polymorphus]|uniref:DIS3-like exonuclease 2 isoform X2 n=1 Tax=Tubulanus polymorphus TaxID=672921 RepID=UPI003DA563F6